MVETNRFSGIPAVPQGGLTEWQAILISAVKENVELLTGLRGEGDLASKAITKGEIRVPNMGDQNMQAVSAAGTGYTTASDGTLSATVDVPSLQDYQKLVSDVQVLADDLAYTRAVINLLLNQLRGVST